MRDSIGINRSILLGSGGSLGSVKRGMQNDAFKKTKTFKFGNEIKESRPRLTWKESLIFLSIQLSMRVKHFFFKLFLPRWKVRSVSQLAPLYLYQDVQSPIKNFFSVNKSFYRGAQPGITEEDKVDVKELEKGLVYLRDTCKVKTILNLRNATDLRAQFSHHSQDHQEKERQAVQQLNAASPPEKQIAYYNIPIESGLAITPQQIQPILAILKNASPNPVFVHCKAGIDRTGLVSFLYQSLKTPYARFEDLYQEMQYCGHKTDGLWQGYVKNVAYHLKTQPALNSYFKRHEKEVVKYL